MHYVMPMDHKWFKKQQKLAGVTAEDIAARMGRHRSVVSRIYSGEQKMSFEWAQAFADTLGVDLAEVLERAGVAKSSQVQSLKPGFGASDAVIWASDTAKSPETHLAVAAALRTDGASAQIWQVRSRALSLAGYLPGDFLLADPAQRDAIKAGDIVLAEVNDWQTGQPATLLRRFEPPALVSASADADDHRVHILDHSRVVVVARIVASWRKI